MAHLVVLSGSLEGKVFPIDPGLTLGREGHNTIAMPDNKRSSRDHAKVWRSGPGRFEIADLGSTNGTLVNDDKVPRAVLKDGDVVQVGDVTLRFELDEAEKPQPKPKPTPAAERPNLADVLKGKAKPAGAAAAQGPAAIEIKQRILQYHKKEDKGGPLKVDLSQSSGVLKWVYILVALAVAGGLFFVVQKLVSGARTPDAPPAEAPGG